MLRGHGFFENLIPASMMAYFKSTTQHQPETERLPQTQPTKPAQLPVQPEPSTHPMSQAEYDAVDNRWKECLQEFIEAHKLLATKSENSKNPAELYATLEQFLAKKPEYETHPSCHESYK